MICDDEKVFVNELQDKVERFMKQKHFDYKIYTSCEPSKVIDDGIEYQIAFLDIKMEPIDGITLAKALKKRNVRVVLFFTTAFNSYQDDAMDTAAFRYFEKPVCEERLFSGLEKAIACIDENYTYFWATTENAQKKIPTNDIVYIERKNRQVAIVTADEKLMTRESFDYWSESLPNSFFYKVHKSIIINVKYVTSYNYSEVKLQNSIKISIAQRRRADFREFCLEYLKGD